MNHYDFQDSITKYAHNLWRRGTYRQKMALLLTLKQDLEMFGYPVKGITDQSRFTKAVNIHVGDVEHAETLIITHYDQPNRVFFSNGEYDPFFETKHLLPQLLSENIVQMAVLAIAIMCLTLVNTIGDIRVTLLFLFFFAFILVYTFIRFPKGIKNRFNYNKNNTALLVVLAYAKKYPKNKNIAFVFTDKECTNHHGDVMLERTLRDRLQMMNVIHLDSIGHGTCLQVACKRENESFAEHALEAYTGSLKPFRRVVESSLANRTSLRFYPHAISVSVGELRAEDFVVIGPQTPKDKQIDEPLIHELVGWLEKIRRNWMMDTR